MAAGTLHHQTALQCRYLPGQVIHSPISEQGFLVEPRIFNQNALLSDGKELLSWYPFRKLSLNCEPEQFFQVQSRHWKPKTFDFSK